MDTTESSKITKFKVGVFSLSGFILIVLISFWVNDRPFWWRGCQFVKISIADATGLKTNSPVRSLGIEIGYLKTVELTESHVALGICITAPIEVLSTTKAYINAEGFLGDKVVELKPVKYLGGSSNIPAPAPPAASQTSWQRFFISEVWAAPAQPSNITIKTSKEIPVGESSQDIQKLVNRVDELVNQMSGFTSNLKEGIDPGELKKTIRELNVTLKNASRTFSPEGGLNQTAQRTLAKLEDAIEQLRDQMTRINKGEGSLGALLNDPSYAEGIKEAINNVNRLLSKVGGVTFIVDVGGEKVNGYEDSRAWGRLGIWPQKDRYYLLGISFDPRGKRTSTSVETTTGGSTTVTRSVQVESTSLLITAMLGKVYL
ncbi:MAG: MlaD family protein, partial [Bdellovibrionota bacterium]